MKRFAIICILMLPACIETEVTRVEEYTEDLPRVVGLPAAFVVDETRPDPGTREIGDCPLYLTDRRNDAQLRLSESGRTSRRDGDTTFVRGFGDYLVEPEDSYGMRADQLLRVDCARYAPVGLIAR